MGEEGHLDVATVVHLEVGGNVNEVVATVEDLVYEDCLVAVMRCAIFRQI